jgi:hypothetical protein
MFTKDENLNQNNLELIENKESSEYLNPGKEELLKELAKVKSTK